LDEQKGREDNLIICSRALILSFLNEISAKSNSFFSVGGILTHFGRFYSNAHLRVEISLDDRGFQTATIVFSSEELSKLDYFGQSIVCFVLSLEQTSEWNSRRK